MLKVRLLKYADHWLGSILAHLLPRPSPSLASELRAVLLIRPGGIGDAVHLVPAIDVLRKSFPDAAIDILAEHRNAGVFVLCPGIRRTYLYDQPAQLFEILRQRYDAVIDTEQWHRLSAVVARLIPAPIKIGFATNERSRLFTHAVAYRHDDYEVLSFLHLLEPFVAIDTLLPAGCWLQVPAAARQWVVSLLPPHDGRPLVAIFPGASIDERRWGAERFHAVAKWCSSRGVDVAVVGGKVDRREGETIAQGLDRVHDFTGRTSLAETAAILERAAVVVSGDSGVLHLAVALDRPTVSLFGPGIARKWAPRGCDHVTLDQALPCSPCTRFGNTPACPHGVRCLNEITVDKVIEAVDRLLNGVSAEISPPAQELRDGCR